MPAAGSTLFYPNREYVFDDNFYKNLIEKTGTDLTKQQVKEIIKKHTQNIAQVIEEEQDGFKLPKGLGYLCVIKYISKKLITDWHKTNKIGKKVYFTNLDTFGYASTVKLYKVGRPNNNSFYDVYMFKPCKALKQAIVKRFKAGKNYQEFSSADFIEKSRLENLYTKKYYKKERR